MEHLSIKAWAEEDRPREKLMLKGQRNLSDAELLAILIRSGTKKHSAVELSKHILSKVNNDLHELARLTVHDLQDYPGIGEAKALSIVAALELGRRRKDQPYSNKKQIRTSKDAFDILHPLIGDNLHEEFFVLFLNRGTFVIDYKSISAGGMAGTVVDAKRVFQEALNYKASSIVLSHNHPSGNLSPSDADIRLTKNLVEAGKVLEISVLDHIIITQQSFYSFADEGLL